MPVVKQRKSTREMTRQELLASLVAFTLVGLSILLGVSYGWYRHGYSIFHVFGVVTMSLFLVSAHFQILGELRKRRRTR